MHFRGMSKYNKYVFWPAVGFLLTGIFSTTIDSLVISFFFVVFLMPVAFGTSLFFNHYLVPKFLMKGDWKHFSLYLIYMLIVSIYLELLVMVLAFVILADYQIENLGKIAGDIYLLTIVLYLTVFLEGTILTVRKLRDQTKQLSLIEEKLRKNERDNVNIRVDRKNVPVAIDDILMIESLGDYVKVHTLNGLHVTKEKISQFENTLPDYFLRVHRSYLVNQKAISSYNREKIRISEIEVPIGRKYRKEVAIELEKSAIS